MTRSTPLSATVFAMVGAVLLVGAVVLGLRGSFAFVGVASVGTYFIAAAMVARATPPRLRAAAVMGLAGTALTMFGLVATPIFYLGWGVVAGAAVLALRGVRRSA